MTTATERIVLSPRLVALVVAMIFVATGGVPSIGPAIDAAVTRLVPEATLDLVGAEVRFEPNLGQARDGVDYVAQGHGYSFELGATGARLSVGTATRADVEMHLVGASGATDVAATQRLPGVSNYLIGDDPSQWHTRVRAFGHIQYSQVYPGIDIAYHGADGVLEYDFIVAPQADPSVIRLAFDGGTARLGADGALVLDTAAGSLTQSAPVVFQHDGATHELVDGRFSLDADGTVSFVLGAYDRSRPLVIDPGFAYSVLVKGGGADEIHDVAVDSDGNVYVTGFTWSNGWATTVDAFQTELGQDAGDELRRSDAFVTKLNRAGTRIIYSTYLGGGLWEQGHSIAVDGNGSAYITGETFSDDFPTDEPFQAERGSADDYSDAFIARLKPNGSELVYSTYIGGAHSDRGLGIALDGNAAYITGATRSLDFPTSGGAWDPTKVSTADDDVFVAAFTPAGGLTYATYIGSDGCCGDTRDEIGSAIAVNAQGHAFITGHTDDEFYPTAAPGEQEPFQPGIADGLSDAFVTRLNAGGSGLIYSTFFGGSGSEGNAFGIPNDVFGIAIDDDNNAYLTGWTTSDAGSGFPITPGVVQPTPGGGSYDAYVAKLNDTGTDVVWSTFLGGAGLDAGNDIAIDTNGAVYVAGDTTDPYDGAKFPLKKPLQNTYNGGRSDAFVTVLNDDATALVYSTYLGGGADEEPSGPGTMDHGYDTAWGIAVPARGDAVVAGATWWGTNDETEQPPFPTTNCLPHPSADRPNSGRNPTCFRGTDLGLGGDGFVTRIRTTPSLRPDGQIRLGAGDAVGDDIYNATGVNQTASGQTTRGASKTFTLTFENDGNVYDDIRLDGDGGNTNWGVRYLDHRDDDITTDVVNGTFKSKDIAPGGSIVVRMRVVARSGASIGDVRTWLVKATSVTTPARVDVVAAKLKLVNG